MSGSIPSWARVGVKVVCIGGSFDGDVTSEWRPFVIPLGTVVTIRAVLVADGCHLYFEEENPGVYWPVEDFRPVIEPKSEAHDLAIFRRLLPQKEDA